MNNLGNGARPQLKKAIGGIGFFALAFGSMIGVGWITTLDSWFNSAGPGGAMLAFVAGGVLMLLIGLCYAELTPMMPVTGGEIAYAYKAFGTNKAFLVGWFLAFGYLSVSAFEAVSIGMVLGYLFPNLNKIPLYEIHGSTVYAPHILLAFIFTTFIAWINYRGVQVAMNVQVALTALLVGCTFLFVGVGCTHGNFENLHPLFTGDSSSASLKGFMAVFVMAPFWFVGFDTIPQAAEERSPGQGVTKLGLYIIMAIIGSTIFYILIMLAAGMIAPWQETVKNDLPTAAAFETAFESPIMVKLVLSAGAIGLLTSWNGFFIAGTRVLFALGRGHIIDGRFGNTHDTFGTPSNAIIFSGIVTAIAACLGRGALIALVDVGSFCIAVAFLGVSLSLLQLRKTHPHAERPYRLPYASVVATLAALGSLFILIAMVIPKSPVFLVWPLEWAILVPLCIAGILFWLFGEKQRLKIDENERAQLILKE
jgi:amino acid transporter